jgi:hypothetical protein
LNWGSGVNLSRDGELENVIYIHMVWWIFTEVQKVREDVDIDGLGEKMIEGMHEGG